MLMVHRQGEQYWVSLLLVWNQPPRFGIPPKSFLGKESLTNFLLNILQIPQELIDKALQAGSIQLSPEQIERWSA